MCTPWVKRLMSSVTSDWKYLRPSLNSPHSYLIHCSDHSPTSVSQGVKSYERESSPGVHRVSGTDEKEAFAPLRQRELGFAWWLQHNGGHPNSHIDALMVSSPWSPGREEQNKSKSKKQLASERLSSNFFNYRRNISWGWITWVGGKKGPNSEGASLSRAKPSLKSNLEHLGQGCEHHLLRVVCKGPETEEGKVHLGK